MKTKWKLLSLFRMMCSSVPEVFHHQDSGQPDLSTQTQTSNIRAVTSLQIHQIRSQKESESVPQWRKPMIKKCISWGKIPPQTTVGINHPSLCYSRAAEYTENVPQPQSVNYQRGYSREAEAAFRAASLWTEDLHHVHKTKTTTTSRTGGGQPETHKNATSLKAALHLPPEPESSSRAPAGRLRTGRPTQKPERPAWSCRTRTSVWWHIQSFISDTRMDLMEQSINIKWLLFIPLILFT